MILTKEIIENLPLSQYPEDYDNVEIITSQIIKDFNEEADKIDMKNVNNIGQRLYHVILNGKKKTVTGQQFDLLEEGKNDIDLDMEWYLANEAVTLEDFLKSHP